MIQFYSRRPTAVTALGDDAVESLVDVTYADAGKMPAVMVAARNAARHNLTMLVAAYLHRNPKSIPCDEYPELLALTIFAGATSSHVRLGANDTRIGVMVTLTNSAYRACGSLKAAIGLDYKRMLQKTGNFSADDVFDLLIWGIEFTEAQLVPGLKLPADARNLPPALWRALGNYPLVAANAYSDGAQNEKFYDTAYLATHIEYLPTGYQRHPIYVKDSPKLYRFLRENFYAVLQMGELDLVSEFVDDLRQFGCTEKNDLQVRDGSRYLLKLFHIGGNRWMTHREPGEKGLDDYDLVHKAWTGISGVLARVPEPAKPGTYGGVVRRWLPHPR